MIVPEDFNIGPTSFLHEDSLNRLLNNHLISKEKYDLSRNIRALFFENEDSEDFTVDCLRCSEKWKHLISLVDETARMS